MRRLICLFAFQSFVCFAFCQTEERKPTISDTIIRIVQQFREYQAVQREVDSVHMLHHSFDGKYNAGVGVAIHYITDSTFDNIADVEITEQLDTIVKVIYNMKYDIKLKKFLLLKKVN